MSENDVEVRFGAQLEGLIAGINQAKEHLEGIAQPVSGIMEAFKGLGEAIIAAFAIEHIVEFSEEYAELGEQIKDTAEILGITTDQFQQFAFAIRMGGGDTQSAATTIGIFQKNIAEAASGSGTAAQAFQNMGISIKQADGNTRPALELLKELAEVLRNVSDANIRAEYGRALLGRGFQNLLPTLLEGEEGFDHLNTVLDKTNSMLSNDQVKALDESSKKTKELSAAWSGLLIELGAGTAWTGVKQFLVDLTEETTSLAKALKEATHDLLEFFGLAERHVKPTALNEFNDAAARFRLAMNQASGGQNDMYGPDAPKSGTKLDPLKPDSAGKDADSAEKTAIAIEKSDLQTKLELYRLDVAAKKDADDAKVASGEMSKRQEIADLISLSGQEREMALQEITAERDLYDRGTAEWEQYNNKKLVVAAQYDNQIARLNAQSALEQKRIYADLAKSIEGAFDGAVNGVLQGTQTIGQAMQRMFGNILLKLIDDYVVKSVASWAAMEAQKLGISQVFDQAMVALGIETATESAATQMAANAAVNTAKITADGALVFAGVFANLAPFLGPAAAGPAEASEAAVLARIPQASLAVGAWDLDSDTVAQLHAGEMVVPKTFAAGLRDGKGLGNGGGDSFTVNIHAIDTQTGASFLQKNIGVIAQGMRRASRNLNPNLKPA